MRRYQLIGLLAFAFFLGSVYGAFCEWLQPIERGDGKQWAQVLKEARKP